MVLSLFWKDHRKGSLSGIPAVRREMWEYPEPSLQKTMVLSRSLPTICGSRASKVPSSLSKPAFSYFQGLPVSTSTSFADEATWEQAVRIPAIENSIVHLENIRRINFVLKDRVSPGFKTPGTATYC